jgi:hypothetical protein
MKFSNYSTLLLTLAAASVMGLTSISLSAARSHKHHADVQSQSASHHSSRHHHTDESADQTSSHKTHKHHHVAANEDSQPRRSRHHTRDANADQSSDSARDRRWSHSKKHAQVADETSARHHRRRQDQNSQSNDNPPKHLTRKQRLHLAKLQKLHDQKLHEQRLHEERLAAIAAKDERRHHNKHGSKHENQVAETHKEHLSHSQAAHLARLAKLQAQHKARLAKIRASYKAHLARLAAIAARHQAHLDALRVEHVVLTPSHSIRAWNDYAAGVPMKIIMVDLNDPKVQVSALLSSNGIGSSEPFSHMIARAHPDVAVTGTFFSLDNLHPVGDIVINGNLAYFGGMGTALCITPNNKADMITVPWGHHHDWSGYNCVVACGPRLLQGGKIVLDPHAERFKDRHMLAPNSRIGVGITKDNKLVFVMTHKPIYLGRLAKAMKGLGCDQAMNLDAGTSTGFYCDGHLMARPGRRLTNAIIVYANHKPDERTAGSSNRTVVAKNGPPA